MQILTSISFSSSLEADYGQGNLHMEGILQFFKSHNCNRFCELLKIELSSSSAIKNPLEIGSSNEGRI